MSARINYNRITGSNIQGDATTVTEPLGTLVVTNNNELRLHDGSTAGGNSIGGGGGVGSFGTDKGIGADYASNNPAILFSDDDMIIRTGGTAGHGTIGAMYIASAEELIIGHTDASLTDATSLGAGNFTDYLQIDTNGIEMTTARGTVQFGYNLEAPGVPTHFHINKLDQSFDLFFGDDSNYFHLPAGSGSPVIGANDGSSGQKLWTFGQDGTTTFPQGSSFGSPGEGEFSLFNLVDTDFAIYTNNGTNHSWLFGNDGTLIVPGEIKSEANTGPVIINSTDGNTTKTWTFGGDGSITFPDATVQTTAYRLQGLAPNSPWGTTYPATANILGTDYQFWFDGTTGVPKFQSYMAGGGNPVYNSVWSVESFIDPGGGLGHDGSGATPVAVDNTTDGIGLSDALGPGDYCIVRIQCLDTGKVYRATFLGSYNAADVGNEGKYGAITVERLV